MTTKEINEIIGLNPTVRLFNILVHNDITLDKLKTMSEDEIMKIRNIGRKCVNEIYELLEKEGVTLTVKKEAKDEQIEALKKMHPNCVVVREE